MKLQVSEESKHVKVDLHEEDKVELQEYFPNSNPKQNSGEYIMPQKFSISLELILI